MLAVALALFQLGNGGMLTLLGQKLVHTTSDPVAWTARYVMVAQLVMVPVALLAGSLADRAAAASFSSPPASCSRCAPRSAPSSMTPLG